VPCPHFSTSGSVLDHVAYTTIHVLSVSDPTIHDIYVKFEHKLLERGV